jgi:vancomycin aglycone glucosyltransferase
MRVVLSTCRSRGDVEPMVGLAVQLRSLGTEVPVGQPVRPLVTELVAAQFDTVAAAAEGCDALVARPA